MESIGSDPLSSDNSPPTPSTPRVVWMLVTAVVVLAVALGAAITFIVVSDDSGSTSSIGSMSSVPDSTGATAPSPTLEEEKAQALLADPKVRAWVDVCGNSLLAVQAIRGGDEEGYSAHIEAAINLSPAHLVLMEEDPGPWLLDELWDLATTTETVSALGLSAEQEATLNTVGERCLFWGDRVASRDDLMRLASAAS